MKLIEIFDAGFKDLEKNSPLVFTILGGIGVVATSIISVRAGMKLKEKEKVVEQKIEQKKKETGTDVITRKESLIIHVREKWTSIAPVVVVDLVTLFCIGKAYSDAAKKIVALTTTLNLTNQAFDSYKKATEKVLGEKEKDVQRQAVKDKIEENDNLTEEDKKNMDAKNEQISSEKGLGSYDRLQPWIEPTTNQQIIVRESAIVRAFERAEARVKTGEDATLNEILLDIARYAENNVNCNSQIGDYVIFPCQDPNGDGSRYICGGNKGINYDLHEGVKLETGPFAGAFAGIIGYKGYMMGTLAPVDTRVR